MRPTEQQSDRPSDSPLRILYVTQAMGGGAKRHVLQLVNHLDRRRFAVSLLCSTLGEPRTKNELDGLRARGFAVQIVEMRRSLGPLSDTLAYRRILSHLRSHRYDIVHTHCGKGGLLGRRAAHRVGVPVIIHTPHVFPFEWATGLRRRLYLALERRAARWSHRIVALTESQKQFALNAGLCDEEKLTVIPNGISTWQYDQGAERRRKRQALALEPDQPLVGTIGRMVQQKGLDCFLRAARRVSEQLPRARFLLLGEGPLEQRLHRLAEELRIADRCLWIPHQAKIEAIYCALDVFVISSLWEGLPYTILEAMAAGCPIVSTAIRGPADVLIHGQTGLLAPPADPEALADRVLRLLTDPALRSQLAQRAGQVVRERYTLDRFIESTQALYESAARATGTI